LSTTLKLGYYKQLQATASAVIPRSRFT